MYIDRSTPLLDWADKNPVKLSNFEALGPVVFAALWGITTTHDGRMFYHLGEHENDSQWLQEFLLAIQRLVTHLDGMARHNSYEAEEYRDELHDLQQLYEWVQCRVESVLDAELEEYLRDELDE